MVSTICVLTKVDRYLESLLRAPALSEQQVFAAAFKPILDTWIDNPPSNYGGGLFKIVTVKKYDSNEYWYDRKWVIYFEKLKDPPPAESIKKYPEFIYCNAVIFYHDTRLWISSTEKLKSETEFLAHLSTRPYNIKETDFKD
jgi:hypothetical protein